MHNLGCKLVINIRIQVLDVLMSQFNVLMSHFKVLLLNQHVRKESCACMMVGTMDLDQEPIPLDSRLWCFLLFPIIIFFYRH